ncbi:Exodeoxyribonuclease 7 small subunit [bioreactor metagenome]|uniref:Exodeoxyribonuclease 7 small subunit n=1 Tax=bioreactor metagenome TaxID=1076179 RepID=A0A645IEG4_9ZZZZ|nr:exodeoxyribonuclease VII small subunit [Clostridium sp. HMP27]KGK89045.1 exodeoxyribonuclease VII small subunit [Clostridium sp. HMP27]
MGRKAESYEGLMAKLEEILSNMDSGEISLEDSMKKYEEGIKICNKLYKILNDSENKIKILMNEGEENFEYQ